MPKLHNSIKHSKKVGSMNRVATIEDYSANCKDLSYIN